MHSIDDKLLRYHIIGFLGEGQFATVYKASDSENENKTVAIKKIKVGSRAEAKDGINRTALREIKLLQELRHGNVIELIDVYGHNSNVSIVMDFMDTDLEVIIKDSSLVLSPANIKSYVLQTLRGLEYLHSHWILHRDLKPNNLLINSDGCLKIGDFGLAKSFGSPNRQYTHIVVTRWYRAPELLFGSRIYGVGIDVWATGCILGELLLRVPLLPGESDLDQLAKIFQAFGTPSNETWPDHNLLPDFIEFKMYPGTPLQDIFTAAGPDLIELLSKLLAMSPLDRCTCQEALNMSYFTNAPAPTKGKDLPLPRDLQKKRATTTKRKRPDIGDSEFLKVKRIIFE